MFRLFYLLTVINYVFTYQLFFYYAYIYLHTSLPFSLQMVKLGCIWIGNQVVYFV